MIATLLAVAAVTQAAILAQQLASDPLALTPINDARVYWQWAGEIARGKLVGDTPFLSAPLYPYLVAVVRAFGGGLAATYVVQSLLHLLTIALLFKIVEKRFGFAAAVAAAGLYVGLLEPAYYTTRILNCTLQLFVVVWMWERMLAAGESPTIGRLAGLGAVLGLNVLANPTMLAAVPLVAVWILWLFGRRGRPGAAVLVAAAGLVIAPAMLHNWLACHELIPVSAHGGVTFYHGNAPGADGTYHGIPGIAENRIQQNIDAKTLTGGGWNETSSLFFRKGLDTWRSDPAAAVRLFGRKLWFFVSGRNYADIYVPELEREDGVASRLALAPIPTAWLTIPALLALAWLVRAPRRHFPELLLLLVPLLTVATFWYSPRYRMPALPLLAGLAGLIVASLRGIGETGARRNAFLGAAAILASILSGAWNAHVGFDPSAPMAAQYQHLVGGVLIEQNRLDEAERRFQAAIAGGYAPAEAALADVYRRQGRRNEAIDALRAIVRAHPEDSEAHRGLAVALAEAQRFPEAEAAFRAALALDPNNVESLSGLGNVLDATGRAQEAIAQHTAAIARNPSFAAAHFNLGSVYLKQGRGDEAASEYREALRVDPGFAVARWYLADLLAQLRRFPEAIGILREGLRLDPSSSMLQEKLLDVQRRSGGE